MDVEKFGGSAEIGLISYSAASFCSDLHPDPNHGICKSSLGAPRIHGELLRLGIEISERTVSRLMPKNRTRPSQTWKTFLANHIGQLVSIDFFTVSIVAKVVA